MASPQNNTIVQTADPPLSATWRRDSHAAPGVCRLGAVHAAAVARGRAVHPRGGEGRRAGAICCRLAFVLPLAFGLAKRVEPDLGALNLVRLLLFANTAAAVVLFVNLFVLYIIFRNPVYLYERGPAAAFGVCFTGGITALLVAYMKPTPFATAPLFPGVPLRVRFTNGGASSAGPLSVLGGYFGWYYLRFLNKNRDQTVGDVSDEFALVVLLPDFCTARAMKALDEKLAKLAHARNDNGHSSLLSVEVRDDVDE
ncbi:hypothetical protein ON010_g16984 [Phytophthora cinnamomi]|nr:hypothetical protein ON010_g16984 [Phytophthora cinnamomi]